MSHAFHSKPSRLPVWLLLGAVAAVLGMAGVETFREQRAVRQKAIVLTGGDPDEGRLAIQRLGCGTCHTVPGVTGANGLVGPPLERMADRVYIAGKLHNTPDNMVQWILDPQRVTPGTAMPRTGADPRDARDITAYLYTLR